MFKANDCFMCTLQITVSGLEWTVTTVSVTLRKQYVQRDIVSVHVLPLMKSTDIQVSRGNKLGAAYQIALVVICLGLFLSFKPQA